MFQFILLLSFCFILTDGFEKNGPEAEFIVRLPSYTEVRYVAPPGNGDRRARILFWTGAYGDPSHWSWWFDHSQMTSTCPDLPCDFTIDHSTVDSADAVVFMVYGGSMNLSAPIAPQLPPQRHQNQRYVFFTLEPPYLDVSGHSLTPLDGVFNWTMTYRRNSDVLAHFGHVVLTRLIGTEREASVSRNYAASKSRLVAWYVSHCQTEGRREVMVAALQRRLPINIYGSCGNLTCEPPRSDYCYRHLQQYKFYLAFENIVCTDYVSEKFWYALAADVVPVVFGGADYATIAPPGSYIDALAFSSPDALADHLLALDADDAAYNKYFDWKRGYKADVKRVEFYVCELCRKLLDNGQPPNTYEHIDEWWNGGGHCRAWNGTAD